MRPAPRRTVIGRSSALLSALVAALALSACSGSGGTTTSTPAASGGASSPGSSADAGKVTLGFSAWPGWFPWQVAQKEGLFAKHGVQVELKYFDSYTDSLNALSTGAVDANSQTLNDTVSSVAGGAPEQIVLVNDNSTGNDQIIAAPGITSVAQLKGKKVAVEQGTVDHYLLLLALAKAGLAPGDVDVQPLTTDAAAAAFVAGRVDAVGAFAPFTTTALGRKGSAVVASSKEFPGAIPDHLVVRSGLVKERPKAVQALVDTWFETLTWIAAHRTEAVAIMAERGGVSPADYATYDAGTTIFDLAANKAAFTSGSTDANLDHQATKITEFLLSTKLIDKKPDLAGLFDRRFVDAVR